jgi:lipid-A-disaccharide synthase
MAAAGMELYYHVNDLAYIVFVEVVRHYFYFRRIFNHLLEVVQERKPDIVVLIDYPGFNLRFAQAVKKRGVGTFYYIAPQVWAWGQGRAEKMARFIDQMAVLFDFEVDFFSRYNLKTTFVGHPLLEGMEVRLSRAEFMAHYGLSDDRPILALVPGSRNQEVKNLLPPLLETAAIIRQNHPELQIVASQAATVAPHHLDTLMARYPWVKPIRGDYYELLRYATAGLVASGTATLEAACSHLPFALVYKVSPLSFAIGKRVVRIPRIGLVNIVAGEEVVPEFLQEKVSPELLAPAVAELLFNPEVRARMIADLKGVSQRLGRAGASAATARLVIDQLHLPQSETI